MTQASGSSFDRLKEVYSDAAKTPGSQLPGKLGGHIIQKWIATTPQSATKATQKTGQSAIPKEIPEELEHTLSQEIQQVEAKTKFYLDSYDNIQKSKAELANRLGFAEDPNTCFQALQDLQKAHRDFNQIYFKAGLEANLPFSQFNSKSLTEMFPDQSKEIETLSQKIHELQRTLHANFDQIDSLLIEANKLQDLKKRENAAQQNISKLLENQDLLSSIKKCLHEWKAQHPAAPQTSAPLTLLTENRRDQQTELLYNALTDENEPPETFQALLNKTQPPDAYTIEDFGKMIKEFFQWLGKSIKSIFTAGSAETAEEMQLIHSPDLAQKKVDVHNKLLDIAYNTMTSWIENKKLFIDQETDIAIALVKEHFQNNQELERLLSQIAQKKQEISKLEQNQENTGEGERQLKELRNQALELGYNEASLETQELLFETLNTIQKMNK
jgi:hypothetical protein